MFIMDCLHYWVREFHVDGFRFDLAGFLAIGDEPTPAILTISSDEVLRLVKLIAEPWSTRHQAQHHFNSGRWARWNDEVQNAIRGWTIGQNGYAGALQSAIADSGGHINYITCHDGFTLKDLVSYNEKHNWPNRQGNTDGLSCNRSWNCGFEGDALEQSGLFSQAECEAIRSLRHRQMKNMLALLFLSRGTPMVLYGDEFGRSAHGNNNIVFKNEHNLLDWTLKVKNADIFTFMQGIIALRKRHRVEERQITWHGVRPHEADLGYDSHLLAWTYEPLGEFQGPLFAVSNAHWEAHEVFLPATADARRWHRLADTSLLSAPPDIYAQVIVDDEEAILIDGGTYHVNPRSTVILLAK